MTLYMETSRIQVTVIGEISYLHTIAMKKAMKKEACVQMAARFALLCPNKFPTRAVAAMLKANGAWKVVVAETRRTD